MLCYVAYAFYKHSCILPLCIECYNGIVTKSKSSKYMKFQDKKDVILWENN